MNALDWSNIGMYWNKKMSQEASKYHQLFTEYSAKYSAMYGDGDGLTQDQREEKIPCADSSDGRSWASRTDPSLS